MLVMGLLRTWILKSPRASSLEDGLRQSEVFSQIQIVAPLPAPILCELWELVRTKQVSHSPAFQTLDSK